LASLGWPCYNLGRNLGPIIISGLISPTFLLPLIFGSHH
jgi:hypothetical protein